MKQGWEERKLGDVCENLDSKRVPVTKRDRIAGEYPYYGATGILDYVNKYIFNEKLVLIGEDGAKWDSGEKSAFIVEGKYWVNNHAHVIKPDRSIILDEWLVYYLNFSDLRIYTTGLTVPKLNQSKLNEITIPLPPLSEQYRLVAILDEAFAAIAKAKENTEKSLRNSYEIFESYLDKVFANPGKDWDIRKLGDKEFIEIIDGDRGKNYPKKQDYLEKGYCLFLNTKNVRPDGFDFNETKFISEETDKRLGKGKLVRNDVVMTTRGTIGNLGVFTDDVLFDRIRINSGMLIFRPNLKIISSDYLFEVLRSDFIKSQIRGKVSGAAQPQLPIKTLVNFTIPVPKTINKQRGIVATLRSHYSEIKKLETIYLKKLANLKELKQSILQKAFEGNL
jgi:type I restriction enzyme S subunit